MRNANRMILLAIVSVVVLWAVPALAFHDEGVAHCNGCHTMHNSYEGVEVDVGNPAGNLWLLVDATPSDTCLNCHSSANSSRGVFDGDCATGHSREKGAGNYIFLTCAELSESTRSTIPGERAGHNLDAPGHGLVTDSTLSAAPGGSFPAAAMGCTSCHDPHGTAAFRLLYGARTVQGGVATFANPAPVAVKNDGNAETPINHTAYNSGMSNWCANCHNDFEDIGTNHKHKVNVALGGTVTLAYNLYNGSDDLTGGVPATAYWPEVPFEDAAMLTTTESGATGGSQVMCLTCHRAHATSAASAGRWDFNVTFNEEDGDAHGTFELAQRISGLSTFANRSLCNKCHVKDLDDELKPDGGPY